MRKQIEMSTSSGDEITITFHDDYSTSTRHSNISRGGKKKHEFDNFKAGRKFFLQYIGALCLDGYVIISMT